MWFAALGTYRDNPWFVNFEVRLLQGKPEVTRLLRTNPFPGAPPRYIRATIYRYWFTDWKTGRQTGAWWNRTPRGVYMRAISMEDVRAEGCDWLSHSDRRNRGKNDNFIRTALMQNVNADCC